MQAGHLDDELLQRLFDGDLPTNDAASADAHLRACATCGAKLAALAKLSELVAMGTQDLAQGADLSGLFERIERGIDSHVNHTPQPAEAPRADAQVVAITRARRSFAATSAVFAGLAAAAAVLLMVYRPGGGPEIERSLPADAPAPTAGPRPTPTEPSAATTPASSEVVQVDFGTNAGTVFDIALADGSSTPVIWINDE
jgi:anti-sigma factor RsiW